MRREQLARILQTRPFKPVKLFLTDGGTVDITHPDLCLLMRRTAVVGVPASAQGDEGDDFHFIDLAHISRFVTSNTGAVPTEEAADENGGG